MTKYQISHTSFAFIHITSARLNPKSRPKTKIAAITDISYAPIALDWRHRLVSLGYDSSQVVVVAADDASLQYFNQSNLIDVKVEPMLHPSSPGWPVANAVCNPMGVCVASIAKWILYSIDRCRQYLCETPRHG